MSYRRNYSMRYFGLYLWFAFVMCILTGVFWGIVIALTGWNALLDDNIEVLSRAQLVADGVLFIIGLSVLSTACKWSLEKTMNHDYKSFKMSFPKEKIKFRTALALQLQVVVSSFVAKYTLIISGIEISEISKVLLDLFVIFMTNYIIVIRWISRHVTITPKDCCSSS